MTEDQNTIANQSQTEHIVKRILTAEAKYIIGVIIFLVGVVAPYYDIKTEIALIKQNHLAHIESIESDLKELSGEIVNMKATELELMKTISAQNAQLIILQKDLK